MLAFVQLKYCKLLDSIFYLKPDFQQRHFYLSAASRRPILKYHSIEIAQVIESGKQYLIVWKGLWLYKYDF